MLILGVSGRKQSGKSTTGNFIYSMYLSHLNISEKVYINDLGQIMVSDLLGDTNYAGVFDPTAMYSTNDYLITKVFDKLNSVIKIYNFADILKQDICINILGLSHEQCYGSDEDKNKPTNLFINNKPASAREILQYIGTDIFRQLKPDVWVLATIQKIQKEKPQIAVITDCRFPNEVDIIKKNNGKVLRLSRNLHCSEHISETILDANNYSWDNFDFIIDNANMSMLEQFTETQNILAEILSEQAR
jgi:hypothetical protein